ncbi:class I SAM-dependent methyltransferase [candidate division WOR-3 bacterium]|nr:class I SAM-dependent methyltransferase [candidate division WOR-3 bacterium]
MGNEKGVLAFLEKTVEDLNIKNIEVVKSNIMKNPFKNNCFDIIIANNTLHHVVRTGRLISNDPFTKKNG